MDEWLFYVTRHAVKCPFYNTTVPFLVKPILEDKIFFFF